MLEETDDDDDELLEDETISGRVDKRACKSILVGVGCGVRDEDEASPKYRVILSFFRGGGLVEKASFGKEDEDKDDDDDDDNGNGSDEDKAEECTACVEDWPSGWELSSIPNTSLCSLITKYTPSISMRLAWIWCLLPLIVVSFGSFLFFCTRF